MKKSQIRGTIYYRTNHLNNTAPLHNLEAYAKENGMEPIIFMDFKSSVGNRPALNNLLKQVRKNKIDIIITDSISRFSRKTTEIVAIFSEFEKYNVKVILPQALKGVTHHE